LKQCTLGSRYRYYRYRGCLAIRTRGGSRYWYIPISRPPPLYGYRVSLDIGITGVSISVQASIYVQKEGSRYPYCTDRICTLSESQRGGLGNRTSTDTETPVYLLLDYSPFTKRLHLYPGKRRTINLFLTSIIFNQYQ